MSQELKPCPFCGGTNLQVTEASSYVMCYGCDADGPVVRPADAAVAAWNTRAASAEDVSAVVDEPIQIVAVAVTREDDDEGLRLDWLLEGGISELEFAGTVLFAMPEANDLCDEDGHAELYRHPQRPVVMPEHIDQDLRSPVHGYAKGWNACLDEFKRLNP